MKLSRGVRPLALSMLAATLLAGCTSTSRPSIASPSFSSAAPVPSRSAPTPRLTAAQGVLSRWTACDHGFSCATLTTPLDAAKPALGTVAIAVTRRPATDQAHRIGSLLVNPGGPGASAVDFLQANAAILPLEVRARFDLVAFDPRGVGHTEPVRCETTQQLDALFHLDPSPRTRSSLDAVERAYAEFDAGCAKRSGRILPYTGTQIVAQDMDRVRAAVGDAKLTYLGYSYGTAIGAEYLRQFPTHVRAMVLDGALDPALTWDELSAGQAQGFDVAFQAFLADCEATRCRFRAAATGPLGAAYDALAAKVATTPLSGAGTRTVGIGEFTTGVLAALYSKARWPVLAAALDAAERGDGSILLALNDDYLERSPAGYANILEANNAVNCIDRPYPRTEAPYVALGDRVAQRYPRFGRAIALGGLICAQWPVKPARAPQRVVAPTSPPVLVVGTTRDPATPYAWAVSLADQLAHGVLLRHEGDGHTAYRAGGSDCVLQVVDRYLLTAAAPKPTTC